MKCLSDVGEVVTDPVVDEFIRCQCDSKVGLIYFPDSPTTWSRVAKVTAVDGTIVAIARMLDRHTVSEIEIEQEFKIAAMASAQQLGPVVLASRVDLGLMLMRYLAPQVAAVSPLRKIRHYGERLRQFHSMRVPGTLDLRQRKWQAFGQRMTMCLATHMLPQHYGIAYALLLETLVLLMRHFPVCPMLLHGDLNPTNLLWSQYQTWFIDFDHVGWGDPVSDVATLALMLSAEQEKALLAAYWGRVISQAEWSAFVLHKLAVLLKYGLDVASMRCDTVETSRTAYALDAPAPFLFSMDQRIPMAVRMQHLSDGFLLAAAVLLRSTVCLHALTWITPTLRQNRFRDLAQQWLHTAPQETLC